MSKASEQELLAGKDFAGKEDLFKRRAILSTPIDSIFSKTDGLIEEVGTPSGRFNAVTPYLYHTTHRRLFYL